MPIHSLHDFVVPAVSFYREAHGKKQDNRAMQFKILFDTLHCVAFMVVSIDKYHCVIINAITTSHTNF